MSTLLAHGAAVPVDALAGAWSADALPLAAGVVGIALYAQAFRRLRRRGRPQYATPGHAALFLAGTAVLVLALVSPLDAVGENYLLSGHMLQHVLVGDLGPLLVLLGLRGPLTFFLLPAPVLRTLAALGPLRAALRFLLRPPVAFGLWVAVVAGWHVPPSYEAALHHGSVHDLEHLSFLVAGFLVWAQLVDPARRRELRAPSGRVLFALGLLAAGHVAVHPLLFGGGVVYSTYRNQGERLLGLSPLADQHWAGIVMTLEQVLTLGGLILVSLWPYLRQRPAATEA